jgi:hypothetical protein
MVRIPWYQYVLLAVLIIASTWAAFSVAFGSMTLLGPNTISIIVAMGFTALVIGFLLASWWIFQAPGVFPGILLKVFWLIALIYGLVTAWVGNRELIVPNQISVGQAFLITGLTLLVIACPIVLSWLLANRIFRVRP